HVAEQHAGAFENRTVFAVPGQAAAAFRACPGVAAERSAFEILEGTDDALLQTGECVVDQGDGNVHVGARAKSGQSCRLPAARARRRESASAGTHRTRPPLVRSVPSSAEVPAWKVTQSAVSGASAVIGSPLRGASG